MADWAEDQEENRNGDGELILSLRVDEIETLLRVEAIDGTSIVTHAISKHDDTGCGTSRNQLDCFCQLLVERLVI